AHLAERSGAKINGIHGHRGRALRAAVAFKWSDAKAVLKCLGNAIRTLLCASHHEAEAAKLFRLAAARVGVQKCWRRKKHGDGIFVDECADDAGIERIRVKHNANPRGGRETERAREAEGVEKRQNAHDAVVGMQKKDLIELF